MSREPREQIIQDLFATLHETLAFFDRQEEVLGRAYAPGKWTIRQILVHLSDTEAVYIDRLRRLSAEEMPILQAFDQDRRAAGLQYPKRDLNLAKHQYENARRSVAELARLMPPQADSRTGTHSEAGVRTFGQVLGGVVSHNLHHLEQLRAIDAGKTWTRAQS